MNREEYKASLEKNNNYCDCHPLTFLYEQFNKTLTLEKRCNYLESELKRPQLPPKMREYLKDYKEKISALETQSNRYYRTLFKFLEKGLLVAKLNSPEKDQKEINYLEVLTLLAKRKDKVFAITLHCANCEQQIEVTN